MFLNIALLMTTVKCQFPSNSSVFTSAFTGFFNSPSLRSVKNISDGENLVNTCVDNK